MDNFIVSARKYRPATFKSVVGQEHITATLKNAIQRGQLAHAYLFCGPRGVGKTTCARIFAKAINCQSPIDNEACGECESCRSFNEGRSFNIHELDAASNNSVDDIRNLIDQVRVPPQVGRYSVYIIDEVHMLSAAAFNAFLKTLEEPPAHAIFILATTEKHKLLPTILSRCQIFDFNRIRVEDSVGYLKYIASCEGVSYDDESLHLIAQKADGGMRDALSMFDKAVSFCGNKLNFREVAETLNVLDYDTYFNMTGLLTGGDYKGALLLFDEILKKGFSGQTFVAGLSSHFRDLLMCKDASTLPLLEITGSLLERYKQQSKSCEVGYLFDAIALLSTVDSSFKTATNQRLHVELAIMKLSGLAQKKNSLESDPVGLVELNTDSQTSLRQPQPQSTGVTHGATPQTESVSHNPKEADISSAKRQSEATIRPSKTTTDGVVKVSTAQEPKSDEENNVSASRSSTIATGTERAANTKATMVSGFSVSAILSGAGMSSNGEHTEPTQTKANVVDPDSEAKIMANKSKFLAQLKELRPRIATALDGMEAKGNVVRATVGTELIYEEIMRNSSAIANLLCDVAKVEGVVELSIDVSESAVVTKPTKVEDKFKYLMDKNPELMNLKKELDLELE